MKTCEICSTRIAESAVDVLCSACRDTLARLARLRNDELDRADLRPLTVSDTAEFRAVPCAPQPKSRLSSNEGSGR